MRLWSKAHRLAIWGVLAACLAAVTSPLAPILLLVPTIQGLQLPVPASAFTATLAAVSLATALAPHELELTAARQLGVMNAALGILVLAPSLWGLREPMTATGTRTLIGLVALVLITTAFIKAAYVSIGLAAYLLIACTLRQPHAEDPLQADLWAAIIDGTARTDLWILTLTALVTGLVLQTISTPRASGQTAVSAGWTGLRARRQARGS